MLSVEEARARILALLRPTPSEVVALSQAFGRVSAEPVLARCTQPPCDVSAMDGFALGATAGTAGARLRVIGSAPAGHPFGGSVAPGEAVRIFTGSVMPKGTDAVLIKEDATDLGSSVVIGGAIEAGRFIRRAGQDFSEGETLIPAGRRLTARDIGLAAAANFPWLAVRRIPKVAILATGDEIALPGERVPPGGIVSSNAHALAALVRAGGGAPAVLPIARDDVEAIAEVAAAARGMEMLITTGGASVGDHDLVQAGLHRLGFVLDFWKVAMRPGKPLISGRVGEVPMLGLPGNPVSAMVCAILFLLPALARLAGLDAEGPATEEALLGSAVEGNDGRANYLRAKLSRDGHGRLVATAFPRQDSSLMRLLAEADALIVRPPNAPALSRDSLVPVIRFDALGI